MNTTNLIDAKVIEQGFVGFQQILPLGILFITVTLTIIASVIKGLKDKPIVFLLSLIGLLTAIGFEICSYQQGNTTETAQILLGNFVFVDSYSKLANIIYLFSGIVATVFSYRYLIKSKLYHAEYYVLILLSVIGMVLLSSLNHLIAIFIALEIMSLSIYVLVGFRRNDRKGNEASIKYFILGSVASAILLYGSSLIYGQTGTLYLTKIATFLSHTESLKSNIVLALGFLLVVVGFLFKTAVVPFQMWMPDVYEGAPTPITAFMTTGLKAAAFLTFLRVLLLFPYANGQFHTLLAVLAVVTMFFGNVVALRQSNLKRMFAYSSIAHTGYLLVGVLVCIQTGIAGAQYYTVLMYLMSYTVMNLGAFGILTAISKNNDEGLMLQDLAGFAKKNPILAFCFSVFIFSLAGIPPAVGFISKYLIFYSAIQQQEVVLVVLSVLCSAISVYYYLRVIVYMYVKESTAQNHQVDSCIASQFVIILLAGLTLVFGVAPQGFIHWTQKAKIESIE